MRLNKESRKICKELYRSSFSDKRLDAGKASVPESYVSSIMPGRNRVIIIDILEGITRDSFVSEAEKYHAVIEKAPHR